MTHALPVVFATLCATAMLTALFMLFRSLRAAFSGEADAMSAPSLVSASRHTLLDEKEALLASLRDLASDHEAGKTSDDDRAHSEGRLRARAKAVLRALDEEISPHRAAAEALLRLPPTLDPEDKEAADVAPETTAPEAAPTAIAASPEVPAPATDVHTTACAACGTKNDDDAAFCKKCGKPLASEAAR